MATRSHAIFDTGIHKVPSSFARLDIWSNLSLTVVTIRSHLTIMVKVIVLVFSSDIELSLLIEANVWFGDGTHSAAPKQFTQLFVMCVSLGNT